jgi:L,D-transpeptidase YcbB
MIRPSFRLLLAAAVVFPVACTRSPRQGGPERRPDAQPQAEPAPVDRATQALRARLASPRPPAAMANDAGSAEFWTDLRRLYESNAYRPVWTRDGEPRKDIAALRTAVAQVAADGLNPADYDLSAAAVLESARSHDPFEGSSLTPEALADADLRLSYTFLKLASHLERGRVPPGKVDEHWFGQQRQDDFVKVLKATLDSGRLAESLTALEPQHPQYAALKRVLASYREVAAQGGWGTLPAGLNLRLGHADPAVAVLRAHLIATGDLAAAAAAAPAPSAAPASGARTAHAAHATSAPAAVGGPVFDKETQDALKRFERRHGLVADGRLNREVLAALDVPVEARMRQVELNLERWRWLPETLGDRYVLVNIPTFQLTAVDHGQTELQMRVVTGKHDSPTPIFSDDMTTVVFSPYWNVPPEIARNETIPAVMRDPSYLERNNLEVVRGSHVLDPSSVDWSRPGNVSFRQRPGAHNALGGVKFLFPNQFDVYLHDTPAEALFARVERDYSHGCVRIEKPFEMAQWVLKGRPEWTPERIKAAMDAGREQQIALKQHIPVYIVYETVWVDDDGTVEFRDDVYGHDAKQEQMLPASPAPGIRLAAQPSRPAAEAAVPSARQVADGQ